jgi:hypothetical protein
VTIGFGLPAFTVVGLPDKAAAESREPVRAALASLGLGLPPRRITVKPRPRKTIVNAQIGNAALDAPQFGLVPDNGITL